MTMVKRRTAGYARVSTDKDEQFTSYEAQIDYYTQFIKSHSDWEFVAVYTDEGISGLNTKRRDGFNQMIKDALDGKIDLIVTKSVSRFARNTVDSLVTIRKLKEKGVEVYFEKENIYTFDGKGELLLTIMSSLAQEESRSISENVTWGQRKRFSDGKISLPYKQFLGYERGESKDDPPVVNPEQAAIVREIYSAFMHGKTAVAIAKQLTAKGIKTPAGKDKWAASTIESILTNEKYRGSARLQKHFTVDFLTKKTKVNEGEVPQYYIEHSHEAIIDPQEWDAVQDEFKRRKEIGKAYSGKSVLSCKLVCGDCGAYYGSKTWHSNDKYRTVIWQCNSKFDKEKERCRTLHITEQEIKSRFLKVYNGMIEDTATVAFDKTATQEISDQAKGNTVELVVDDIKEVSLNTVQKEAVQKLDTALIIDAYLVSGGTKLCTEGKGGFGGGKATVMLPYEIKNNRSASNYNVYYVDDAGKLEKLAAKYDKELAAFVFDITHFSNYVVAYDENACLQDAACVYAKFIDANTKAWYHDGVHFCVENGYMQGVSDTKFDPSGTLSRGMIVTMLWRMDGQKYPNYYMTFKDVPASEWYTEAVRWAAAEKIVSGYDAEHFGPNDPVTREQLATMLYNYAKYKGQGFTGDWMFLLDFVDRADISSWANEAVHWCSMKGIVNGKTENGSKVFDPQGKATRAEAASMVQRFCEAVSSEK
jgi:DNA invertase Pin-like site-specific DNA recombinase